MEKIKLSIIVPVYNTGKYLEKCINSLINQTYKNIEIVIVEDCSTDNSKKIIKKFENIKNVKIIYNKKNSGLSYSRNIGILNSTGEYVGFIDSDDYVDLDYYEKIINKIQKEKADLAICDVKIVYENTNEVLISKGCENNDLSVVNIINNGLAASACNKVFKRSLISQYQFSEGKVNEDIAVVIPAICNAKKITYIEECYYYYIQHNGSIQNSSFSEKRFDIVYGIDLTLSRIKNCKQYDEIEDALVFNQIITLFMYVLPKENNFIKRLKFIKKYVKLTKKYEPRKNHYFWNFLAQCGTKHRIYYKLMFKFAYSNLFLLTNLLISAYKILIKLKQNNSVIKENILIDDLVNLAKKQKKMQNNKIKISVVIPNYNYERFLFQRLYSILNQNYKLYEIIILDDKSSDNSVDLINSLEKKLNKYVNIKVLINEINSGSAFKQWQKGFEMAKGDYVWIAEADDYCDKHLISNLVKPILKNQNIIISYSDTAFINAKGNIILKTIKPEIDIQNTNHWNNNFVNNGIDEIQKYCYLNNTIANVSSSIIKNGNYHEYLQKAGEYKQCGDWYLYVSLISNGDISYIDKTLNYYRVHGTNVSSTMNREKHIKEITSLYELFTKNYSLNEEQKRKMKERIAFLKKAWKVK